MNKKLLVLAAGLALIAAVVLFVKKRGAAGKGRGAGKAPNGLRKMDAYDGMSLCGGLVFFAPVALLVRTQAGISETSWRRPWWRESPPVCPPERPAPICTLCTVNRTICPRLPMLPISARQASC